MATISVTENKTLMAQARESLRGKWGLAIGVIVVFTLIIGAIEFIPIAGMIITLIIGGPFTVGLAIFALALSRNQDPKFSQLFAGFNKFGVALGAYLLQGLFVLLWSLLLIIPGIIAALSYSQTYFIIAENDSIGPLEAITKSKMMMKGNRWKFFCLGLRFLGWLLLSILTLGIGLLWLIPYIWISYAKFYDDIPRVETEAGIAKTAE